MEPEDLKGGVPSEDEAKKLAIRILRNSDKARVLKRPNPDDVSRYYGKKRDTEWPDIIDD